ncbi:MAG: cytochrome c3 family protein, partial [Methanobacteriota archaeon]
DLAVQRVKKGDNVFIYYAGHGWFDDVVETGYWVTSEATKEPATFLENNSIYKYITALDKKGAQHVLVVSDSCFAGSFTKEHRAIETEIDDRYFQEKYKKPSRNILASGGVEPVADIGKDDHSIFAYYFLKVLRDNTLPFLSAKQLGVAVEQLVCRNSDQTPISRFIHGAGDEGGQFFFINRKSHGSGQATEPIAPEPVISPKDGKATFDDILKAEQIQREVKEKWGKWQEVRETEYREVLEIDKSENLNPKQKAVAWQRFLVAISQDNPHSRKDDEMRSHSRSQALHWEDIKPVKKAEPVSTTGTYDGNIIDDIISMKNKAYSSHTKGIVKFSHKRHSAEYKADCGECHHDANGQPLTGMKMGDEVRNCIECHNKAGLSPKGKDAPKLSKKEKMAYHAEAIHENCKCCHVNTNKKSGKKTAPTSCSYCHPKK